MPLTQQQLEDIRSEVFADDVDIISAMQLWSIAEVTAYFESGGTERPTAGAAIVDLTDATQQQPKYPPIATPTPPSAPRSFADFDKTHMTVKKGDSYRIEFPFSSEMLQDEARFGSAWLTRAFRTFGSISKHNSVKIISIKTFVGGGAASKALLTVGYSKPDECSDDGEPLQNELFCKMPHPEARKREKYLNACLYNSEGPEVAFAQKFYRRVPFRCARTYFADRCDATTNYIIITETLAFASEAVSRLAICIPGWNPRQLPSLRPILALCPPLKRRSPCRLAALCPSGAPARRGRCAAADEASARPLQVSRPLPRD